VDCGRARALIHEAIDTGTPAPDELAGHLASCAACRAAQARLRLAQNAFTEFARRPIDEDALRAVTDAVLRPPTIARRAGASRWRAWVRPLATACAVTAVFALGLVSGRWLWPVEVVRTELVPDPQVRIVEKPIRVEVPVPIEVVRERVVTRRVLVYVSRPANGTAPSETGPRRLGDTAGPTLVNQLPVFSKPVITNEIHPTTIVDKPRDAAGETTPTSKSSTDAGETLAAAATTSARTG